MLTWRYWYISVILGQRFIWCSDQNDPCVASGPTAFGSRISAGVSCKNNILVFQSNEGRNSETHSKANCLPLQSVPYKTWKMCQIKHTGDDATQHNCLPKVYEGMQYILLSGKDLAAVCRRRLYDAQYMVQACLCGIFVISSQSLHHKISQGILDVNQVNSAIFSRWLWLGCLPQSMTKSSTDITTTLITLGADPYCPEERRRKMDPHFGRCPSTRTGV